MTVIAEYLNHRKDYPELNVRESLLQTQDGWKKVFKRKCNSFYINTAGKMKSSYLVSIHGAFFDVANTVLDEVVVSGIRCPIHAVRKVGKSGNKTLVDVDVALETVTHTNKVDIKFPTGFAPACFVHPDSQFEYMAIVFHDLEIVAIDVTPVGFTVLWDLEGEAQVFLNGKSIGIHNSKIHIDGTEPLTKHSIVVQSIASDDSFEIEIQTPDLSVESMTRLYRSKKNPDGVYDLSRLSENVIKFMRKHKILGSGNTVIVNGELQMTKKLYKTQVRYAGESCELLEGNLYIVPDFDQQDVQFMSFDSNIVEFDQTESYVSFDGKTYVHGDKFNIHNSLVTVVKGSLIFVITNDAPKEFAESPTQVINSGDLIVRDIVMRSMSQLVEKQSTGDSYVSNSFFIYDSSTGETTECSKMAHRLSEDGTSGSVEINVLHTDSESIQTMFNTLSTKADQTTVSTKTDSGDAMTTTFSSDGLSFDLDSGAVYFGGQKEFRIQFVAESGLDPNALKIQSLDTVSGEYVTRFLITDQG